MLGNPHATNHSRDGGDDDIEVDTRADDEQSTIENEGINRLIHDTFGATDENTALDEMYENIHDVPLIDKAKKTLYKDSKTSLLSALLLLVNFKVINGLSNTAMTQLLRYARFIYMLLKLINYLLSL